MKATDLLSIPPKDWDLSEFPSLEVDPERIIIKAEQPPFEFYIEGDEVRVSPNFHRWKFSVDNGKSWFVFREFEQMPKSVQEAWRNQTPINPVVSYEMKLGEPIKVNYLPCHNLGDTEE